MSRRQAREMALQVLYAVEMGKTEAGQAFEHIRESFGTSAKAEKFSRELVEGTLQHIEVLDEVIKKLSKRWDINRLATVDRNIIRLALYEILYRDDIPPVVSINEAVELAKVFGGGEESGRFVNGILGQMVKHPEKYKPEQSS
ncbi:N utilization substance protein B [Desulfohalotomaculum tongense]|uniref:transcription antitermination factor NusB n=1 Tax=Desulforadius tongensis TaxID=1216062 RepID=UPI0019586FA6|nr:transcription antitermination factor NusB [Desulforadius tongensis]MBM7855492.1 N utilization substance protein B [Desulforadius tongensis]